MKVDEILAAIAAESEASGVPADLMQKVFGAENFKGGKIPSAGEVRTDLTSPKGARGLFQVMPETQASLERMGLVPKGLNPNDPLHSIKLGAAVLKESLGRTKNPTATLAEYNGGAAARRAVEAGREPPAEETRRYLANTGASAMTPQEIEKNASLPRTTRVTTTQRGAPGEIASLMQQLDAYSEQQRGYSQQLTEILQTGAQLERGAAGNVADAGESAAAAIQTKGDIDARRMEKQQDILQLFGVSTETPDSPVVQRRQEIANLRVQQDQLQPEIEARLRVSVLDDPVSWIMNQFELPGMKKQFNSARRQELMLLKRDSLDRQEAQQQIALDVPNTVQQVKLLAAQQASATRANAAFEAAKAEGKAQHLLAASLQEQMANEKMDFQTRMNLSMRLMETTQLTDASGKQSEKFNKDVSPINAKRVALGLQPYSEQGWADLGPQARTQIREWAMLPGYGTGPGDTLRKLNDLGAGPGFVQAAPQAAQALGSMRNSVEFKKLRDERLGPNGDPKFKALPAVERDGIILDELAEKWQAEVRPNKDGRYATKGFNYLSPDNPFRLDSTRALSVAELKDNLLNQTARDQFKVDPARPMSDVQLAEHAKRLAIADPANIQKYAQHTAQYFQAATKHQFKSRQLALLGFQGTDSYVLSGLDNESATPRALQMTSPSEIERWMMSEVIAAQRALKFNTPAERAGTGSIRGLR